MPKLDPKIQQSFWKMANALAKALRAGGGKDGADPQWRVSALASRAWRVSHPDLPLVDDQEGVTKDTLLQFHVQQDEGSGLWFVVAQNKVVGPDSHASPRALIVAKKDTPPGDDWNFDEIAEAAANFFRQQKEELVEKANTMMPKQAPGAMDMGENPAPGSGGPAASRRRAKDYRVGVECPHCGSHKTHGARAMEKGRNGSWGFANTACSDCGNGFSTAHDGSTSTLDTNPERDRSQRQSSRRVAAQTISQFAKNLGADWKMVVQAISKASLSIRRLFPLTGIGPNTPVDSSAEAPLRDLLSRMGLVKEKPRDKTEWERIKEEWTGRPAFASRRARLAQVVTAGSRTLMTPIDFDEYAKLTGTGPSDIPTVKGDLQRQLAAIGKLLSNGKMAWKGHGYSYRAKDPSLTKWEASDGSELNSSSLLGMLIHALGRDVDVVEGNGFQDWIIKAPKNQESFESSNF